MTFTKIQVMEILNANDNKKVSTIIPMIMELKEVTKTKRQKLYILDEDNEPFAIFCYYHKQWELLSETSYGIKSSSKTGLNTMCKLGTNNWTKQQKISKKQESELLTKLMSNEVTIEEAETIKNQIEEDRQMVDLEDSIGYTLEEIIELLNKS